MRSRKAVFVLIAVLVTATLVRATAQQSDVVSAGVVVESVGKNSLAEKAGILAGDVLLSWDQGDRQGVIDSPFALHWVEYLHSQRTHVRIAGLRNGEWKEWDIGRKPWGLIVRPNFSGRVLAIYLEGRKYAGAGKINEAVEKWRAAIQEDHDQRHRGASAWLLSVVGIHLRFADRWDESDEAYRRALRLVEKDSPEAAALMNVELANSLAGRLRWREAEQILLHARESSNNFGEDELVAAWYLYALGVVSLQHGQLNDAEQRFRRALSIFEEFGSQDSWVAASLVGLGLVASAHFDLDQAERCYHRAFEILENTDPGSVDVGVTLDDLGALAYKRGDLRLSEEYYLQALSVLEKTGYPVETGRALSDLAIQYLDEGKTAKAETYLDRAKPTLEKLESNSQLAADILTDRGRVAQQRGDLAGAEKLLLAASAIHERNEPEGTRATGVLQLLGDVARDRGDYAGAENWYRKALAIREKLAPESALTAESAFALGRLARRRGQPEQAAHWFEQALASLESQTTKLGGADSTRFYFRAKYAGYYRDYIDLLIEQKNPALAFEVAERSRARTLLETLAGAHVDVRKGVDRALLAKEQSMQQALADRSNYRLHLLKTGAAKLQLAAVNKSISQLLIQYGDIEAEIRAGSPGYAALMQPRPLRAVDVQEQLLDGDTLLLEYALGEERSHVFAVQRDSLNSYELPGRAVIENLVRRIHQLFAESHRVIPGETGKQRQARWRKAEKEYALAAEELGRMVIGPVAGQLGRKRVLVVADGGLAYMPFAALPVPNSRARMPLVTEHEIVNLPSASVLAVLRQEAQERKPATKSVAVLADPVFDKSDGRVGKTSQSGGPGPAAPSVEENEEAALSGAIAADLLMRSASDLDLARGNELQLPRLLYSRREAGEIVGLVPDGRKILDFQATRLAALNPELGKYRIVHFATHGLLDGEHPEMSGLVFSLVDEQGNPQNGFLGLQDIYNLNLPAELVVLSACETGLGKNLSGEGLIGLTRGFMYAGATRVVASMWEVSDVATAELMVHFYRAMEKEGKSPAAALRQAQIEMWKQKRWSSPYYWAAFQIYGEWR